MLASITIAGVISTNVVLRALLPDVVTLSAVDVPVVVSSSGSNQIVLGDRIFLVSSNAVTKNNFQLSTSVPATYFISDTNIGEIDGSSANYVANGSVVLLAKTDAGAYTAPLTFYQNSPGTVSNFYAFNAGTLGSNINLTISNHYGGKVVTASPNGTWDLFQDYGATVLNTNCWANGIDFSGFISRGMSGDGPVTLITSRHGITCAHAWGLPVGLRVYAVGTNGVRYTNWIESSSTYLGDDARLVTFSNNFPSQVNPFYLLPTNWSSKLSIPDWSVCWFRANSQHLATARTVAYSINANYTRANISISGSAFNETIASGGDSGGPMWLMLSNRLVFVGALYSSSIDVPFVSNMRYFTNIVAAIGTNTLNLIDISNYP